MREGEAKYRERAALYQQELSDMEEAAQKLNRLSKLQEKRRLEHSAGGDPAGAVSTLGEPITILSSPSSSKASTSAIEMTERDTGHEATNPLFGTNLNLVGTNSNSINY